MAQLYMQDKQGNKYTNEDLGFVVSSKVVPDMPTQILYQDSIPYSRKKVTYRREDQPRTIKVLITFVVDTFSQLSEKINLLNNIFQDEVILRFDEIGYIYYCNLVGDISQDTIIRQTKKYELIFETTTPYRYAILKSNQQLMTGDGIFTGMGFNCKMKPTVFNVTGNTTVNLYNAGNYSALPVIKVTGTCSNITIGSLVYNTSITGNLVIDCVNQICYRQNGGSKENKLMYLSGSFMEIPSGDSTLSISGTNLDVTVEIIFEHTYR